MAPVPEEDLSAAFPGTWRRLPEWARLEARSGCEEAGDLPGFLTSRAGSGGLPEYLPEMAELEAAVLACRQSSSEVVGHPSELGLNPSLSLIELQWKGLLELVSPNGDPDAGPEDGEPVREETAALLWWDPFRRRVRLEQARDEDLLVLKMVAEGIDPGDLASEHGLSLSRLYTLMHRGKSRGVLLGPASRLQRPPEVVPLESPLADRYQAAEIFTLQWHVTDACDMRCRHCYGVGEARPQTDTEAARGVLQDMAAFCREKNVRGQITFTGGNPLMHPDFFELYRMAVREGFLVAILGNPADAETLDRLLAIETPVLYQVSLEGLREHNDAIRQKGHYDRVLAFLDRLGERGVPSQVMLTLTRANTDQVLPLAEVLRNRTGRFTYNRISLVGSGAALQPPDTETYADFLGDYLRAARNNPVLRLKDNLLNPALASEGGEPFGGCTGYGCGAAFNFLALLPDGQVHACRKFPSPIGSILDQSLGEIYDSSVAAAYRRAPEACLGCSLAPVCRGCPAVVHSFGGDVFRDRDPYCRGGLEPELG